MRKYILWVFLILFFLLLSFIPTLYELSLRDQLQGRTFELVHNYITDYHFYLSRIREGLEGRWSVVELYTSEPHNGSFIQIFYLFLGKPFSFMTDKVFASQLSYHLARIFFGGLLLGAIAYVAHRQFNKVLWQILAFLTVVSASSWPIVVSVGSSWRLGGYMSWWTLMDSLGRITFLPHLLLGQLLLVLLLLAGSDQRWTQKPWQWGAWGIAALILGIVFPPGLLFVGVFYGITISMEFVERRNQFVKKIQLHQWFSVSVVPKVCIGLISLPSLLYFQVMFRVAPWNRLVELDVIHPLPFKFGEYILALGPTLPLGILGFMLVYIWKEKKMYWLSAWVITWVFLLWIFQFIPQQSPLRFSEMAPQIPLGILTTYLFYRVFRFVREYTKKKLRITCLAGRRANYELRIEKGFSYIILYTLYFMLLLTGFGVMVSSIFWHKDFIDQKVGAGYPAIAVNNYIVYPIVRFTDGLGYIEKETPRDAVVLSLLTAGNYIPPFSGRSVYVGHDNTLHGDEKLLLAKQFFRGEMTGRDAQAWLTETGISHIFFGPQEKEEGKLFSLRDHYPFLHEVFSNSDVVIYAF